MKAEVGTQWQTDDTIRADTLHLGIAREEGGEPCGVVILMECKVLDGMPPLQITSSMGREEAGRFADALAQVLDILR